MFTRLVRWPVVLLVLVTGAAAWFRLTGLAWGAPYFHFHIDEHFVFDGADMLRRSVREAALSDKFFMYGPLPMWLVDAVRAVYERIGHVLVLTRNPDEIVYMVMGRAISAVLGTATVPLVYLIARRVAGAIAGVVAAALLAASVVHLRESHFFSVDITMLFFATLSWLFAIRIVETGRTHDYVMAGLALGAALACKYTALFMLLVIAVAHLASPRRPATLSDARGWLLWVGRGFLPVAAAVALFLAIDPMAITYYTKFRADVNDWVIGPNSGIWRPIFVAQFADITPRLYWFTNVLPWGIGPALEIAGIAGVLWLLARRDRLALVAAAFPMAYYATAGEGIAPFMRYAAPLAVGFAVSAAVFMVDLARRDRLRRVGQALIVLVCLPTWLYAAAYMHIYLSPDARLAASAWIASHIPPGAQVLVEPSHNIPPMGSYRTGNVDFNGDYVMWGTSPANRDKLDEYNLHTLDMYRTLYDRGHSDGDRQAYIQSRLARADWIVMDDTFLDFYQHLPEAQYGVVKQYYRDLFAGRLGFRLIRTFKVYPQLFGHPIVDDNAELTFRLFDHPRVFIFQRVSGSAG